MTTASDGHSTLRPSASSPLPSSVPPPYRCLVCLTCGLVHIWTCPEPRTLEMALVRDPRVGRPLSAAIRYGLGNALPLLVNQ
jgi:hypothetical protein